MPTAQVYTAERMKQIEDSSIVGAAVVGGHLMLTLFDGTVVDAGVVSGGGGGSTVTVDADGTLVVNGVPVELAADNEVVKLTGDQTVAGKKTFSTNPGIPAEAFGTAWGTKLEPATKKDLYDKIITLALDGASVFNVKNYLTAKEAADAANAFVLTTGNTTGAVLYFPPGQYNTAEMVTVDSKVAILGYQATLRCTTAVAGLHIPKPDSVYLGLTINGNNIALGTDATGMGADAVLKIGTEYDVDPPLPHVPGFGEGAKAVFFNISANKAGAGGIGCAIHNLQNSDFYDLRVNDCDNASVALLIDNGSKNLNFFGIWPTVCPISVKVTTSGGTQRTSKINFIGGLLELAGVGIRLEDCEQITISQMGMNGQSGTAGVYCVAGGNRDTNSDGTGDGVKGPTSIHVFDCQIKGFTSAFQLDTGVTLHVAGCTIAGSTQTYKVESNSARIIEYRPHFNEASTVYTSVGGYSQQTVMSRPYPPRSVVLKGDQTTWTDMPSALTELNGIAGNRMWVNAAKYTHARIIGTVVTAGSLGAKLRLMYATAEGAFGTFLTAGTTDIEVAINAAGAVKSSWVPLASGAKAEVIFALAGVSGNGTADPVLGNFAVEFY